jgi:3-hydroxyisobutyrate dehydrogenase
MGTAMTRRLLETGHSVTVWNRSSGRAAEVIEAGAVWAETPAALVDAVDIALCIVFDAPALEAVFHGEGGVLAADLAGKLIVEMSTVRPQVEQALAEAVTARGGAFIECPVGGTVPPARTGKLIGMVGGSADDFARARPVLEAICRRVEHCGPIGAGAAMKLAINLPLGMYWQALGEAMSLVRHLKHDPAWLVDLLADTSGAATALRVNPAGMVRCLVGDTSVAPSFDLDGVRKDQRTMLEEATSRGLDLPLVRRTLAVYDAVAAEGHGGREVAYAAANWAAKADHATKPTKLTLALADIVIEAALREGLARKLAPLTVAVLDAGGHLVSFKRQDGSGIARYDIAFGKAWGSLGMGFGSREFLARSQANPSFIVGLAAASGGRMMPVPGGVLIKTAAGEVVGAVGISGDTSDQDEACCVAGIAAAGLVGQTGA